MMGKGPRTQDSACCALSSESVSNLPAVTVISPSGLKVLTKKFVSTKIHEVTSKMVIILLRRLLAKMNELYIDGGKR
jgi:hypothetical protein